MITFPVNNFLDGYALEFAKLIGNTFSVIGANPVARYVAEADASIGAIQITGSGAGDTVSNWVYQPGKLNVPFENLPVGVNESTFYGDTYFSFTVDPDSAVPATYDLTAGIRMVQPLGDESSGPDIALWTSRNAFNPLQPGQHVIIPVPRIPYYCMYLTCGSSSGTLNVFFSVATHGLVFSK